MGPGMAKQPQTATSADLTDRQREVLTTVETYNVATGEPCPAAYLARRLGLHHSTVRQHLDSLHRKGWLRAPGSPARLRRR